MAIDSIEREIFIHAGIERVWSLVSRAGFWVGDELCFEHAAAEGELVTIDTPNYGSFPVRVVRLDPPRYAAYRWASAFPGALPEAGRATLVEFTLEEQDGGVLLRVTESGFAALAASEEVRLARHADNLAGWAAQLALLRAAAERVAVG